MMAISVISGIITTMTFKSLKNIWKIQINNLMILYYDYFQGEVSGFTETKLKSILTTIEACSNTTSLCSISVEDLTAAKEQF